MSVSRRTVGATLTGEIATDPTAAIAAAADFHAPEHILPVGGHDDALDTAKPQHAHDESSATALQNLSHAAAKWAAQGQIQINHNPIVSGDHLLQAHTPSSHGALAADASAMHDTGSTLSDIKLPGNFTLDGFGHSLTGSTVAAGILAQQESAWGHVSAHPFVQHVTGAASDSAPSDAPDPELWIAATQGTSQNYITHADDDGTGNSTATNSGDFLTPISANNPSIADGIDGLDLFQLDTQDNVYFIGTQRGSNAAKIMEGSLSTILGAPTGTPTFTTLFQDNTGTAAITGLAVDPDNSTVYFVDSQSFEKVGYAGGAVTNLDTAGVFLDGLALDLPHHVAYFASGTTSTGTTTTFVGGTHVHYITTTASQVYETSSLTNSSSSVTISKLADIPVADGAIYDGVGMPGITVDTTTGIIYFTTKTVGSHEGGIWSMTSGGTITKIYQQTGAATTLNNGIMNSIVVDHATGEYFVSILNHNGTGGGIYVGHIGSTAAPTLWETLSTFSGGTIDPSPEGFSLDNAPTFASVTGAGTYALQGGSQILTLSGDGADADSDNDKGDGAKIVITNPQSGDILEISGSQSGTSSGITWSYNSTTHTMTLFGTASFAQYQALIDTIQFQDTGTDNSTGSHPTRTITYQVYDGLLYSTVAGATTVTQQINRAPVVTADSYSAQESAGASGTAGTGGTGVLGNDNDKDGDSISVSAVNGSAGNVASGTFAGTYGHLNLASDGHFTYTADLTSAIDSAATGSHPIDTFTYTTFDGINGSTTTTVSFTINRAPTLGSDSYNVVAANSATGTAGTGGTGVLGNDTDHDGDSLTVSAVNGSGGNVASGTLQGTYGHFNLAADGHFTYSADNTSAINAATAGSRPTDSFTYTVSDGHGGTTTQTATFTIDRAPALGADSYNVVESASVSGTSGTAGTGVLGNDSDKDGDAISVSAVNGSAGNVASGTFQGTYGHLNLAADGHFTYSADNTSAIDSAATGSHLTDSFTYTVSDGSTTTSQTVTFTLDRAPTTTTQNETVAESGTSIGTGGTAGNGALAGDSDRDGDSLLVTQLDGNGIGDNIDNFAGTYGHLSLESDGEYTYVADNTAAIDAAPTGSHPVDTFTVTVNDDFHGGTTTETLNFSIDRAAIAQVDPITTTESSTVTASTRGTGLLGNDSDPDTGNNTGLSVTQVNGSAGNVGAQINFADGSFITINADGTYTYDPNHAWDFLPVSTSGAPSTGTETFTYQITGGAFVTDTIIITGQDSNDTLQGTAGADTYNGGFGDDQFKMQDGGNDNVSGGVGDDRFYFGSVLTAADVINGGTNTDTLILGGNYTGGNALVLSATSLTSVEEVDLHGGFSYSITTNDANVASGQTLIVSGAQMGAGDALTFNGSAELDGHFNISLGSGNDNVTGGAQSDTFNLGRGGIDIAHGGGGNDIFLLGGALSSADTIDGGTGSDAVTLNGDYSGGNALTLSANTLTSIEQIRVTPGDNYNITTNDGNVAAGAGMTINATALGAGDSLTFNGSAETDGSFTFKDGAGNDVLTGGAQHDVFDMAKGGNDHVNGGGGNDVVNFDGQLTAADVIDGGSGSDEVTLLGDYSAGITFNSNTIANVEKILVYGGDSYNIILNGLNVASGASLTVDGSNLTNGANTLTFDGSAIGANSTLHLIGGAGGDTLIGGNGEDSIVGGDGNDSISGGNGRDYLTGGAGSDTFNYASPTESTSTNFDTITDMDFSTDHIHLAGYFVNAIDAVVTTGTAGPSNFDFHMETSVGAGQLAAHDAVLFTADHGGYAGHTYLVIDLNGAAGYQAGADLVIDITGATNTGSFSLSTFS
ncbi:MAG TPA: VCBS domain-containing protein [Rhizomicrobium sp.]|jgi:VCBS repeat-containing protein